MGMSNMRLPSSLFMTTPGAETSETKPKTLISIVTCLRLGVKAGNSYWLHPQTRLDSGRFKTKTTQFTLICYPSVTKKLPRTMLSLLPKGKFVLCSQKRQTSAHLLRFKRDSAHTRFCCSGWSLRSLFLVSVCRGRGVRGFLRGFAPASSLLAGRISGKGLRTNFSPVLCMSSFPR